MVRAYLLHTAADDPKLNGILPNIQLYTKVYRSASYLCVVLIYEFNARHNEIALFDFASI